MIKVKPFPANKQFSKFITELEVRMQEAADNFAYGSAAYVFDDILARLPSDGDTGLYRKSLKLVRVDDVGYAIKVDPVRKLYRKLETGKEVVYVRPKTSQHLSKFPGLDVLVRYGPWPVDLLPYIPPTRQAALISRRVRVEELEELRRKLEELRPQWVRALKDAGIRLTAEVEVPPRKQVWVDVAFNVLRLEFGLGDGQALPHWRPALRRLATEGFQRMLSTKSVALEAVKSLQYSKVVKSVDGVIPLSELSKYEGFQDRVRVAVR